MIVEWIYFIGIVPALLIIRELELRSDDKAYPDPPFAIGVFAVIGGILWPVLLAGVTILGVCTLIGTKWKK